MRSAGVIIMSFFAAIWWEWGISNTPLPMLAASAAGAALSIFLAANAVRANRGAPKSPEAEMRQVGRLVAWASAAEGVAILVAVNVLNWLGLPNYNICAIAVIVGLHFIPLARIPRARLYNLTALALVAIGLGGCLLPWPSRGAAVGMATALAIWATCAAITVVPSRPRSRLVHGAA